MDANRSPGRNDQADDGLVRQIKGGSSNAIEMEDCRDAADRRPCAGAGLFAAATPAEARDYPYCLTSPGYGYPGECSYASYGQCRAAASGRLADCIVNPRAAFREPRHRDYRTYGQSW
ncbi:DUF3551 domain-containing protein [Rhodopseudomonas palustris]|nr:hypothetical protein B1S06_04410 [Rhodopseudomonas palustris]RJF66700.1 DUF3551 domain-containing protein [Rhodopseudomonas palustris]